MQMGKQILLVNDLPGYGKVALAAMMPVLAHMGHITYNLPTALVSNTLDYGKFEIQDTTHFMRNTLKVWQELGFTFDAISTGFIVSHEQADLISSYCCEKRKTGTKIFVDPIMGDEGHLYNGLTEDTVKEMRELARNADYMVPIRFPGTGDIFSSIFMGEILNSEPLIRSVEKAMGAVKLLIMKNKDSQDTFKGIAIENSLEVLD